MVLFGVLKGHANLFWPALALATLGNTLGGMSSYLIGQLLPQAKAGRGLTWVSRYGVAALLLSWLPIIGDALCVAAGWLRLKAWQSALFMAIGKFARYWLVAYFTLA